MELFVTDRDVSCSHRRTHTAYVYDRCMAWYNVVFPRIHSSVKYSQLGQSANVCDVGKKLTRILYMWKNRSDNKHGI